MKIKAKLLNKEKLTQNIYHLDFKLVSPKSIDFKAGQCLSLVIKNQKRIYSIASETKDKDKISFCVDIAPKGVGSRYIEKIKKGDTAEFDGPFGVFVIDDLAKNILFVATGSGIAPFRTMIPDLLRRKFKKQLVLIFGVRTSKDLLYNDFFLELATKHKNFKFVTTLSKAEKGWEGNKGRVTDYLKKHGASYKSYAAYLSGGMAMIQDVRSILIKKGLNEDLFHTEVFSFDDDGASYSEQ